MKAKDAVFLVSTVRSSYLYLGDKFPHEKKFEHKFLTTDNSLKKKKINLTIKIQTVGE